MRKVYLTVEDAEHFLETLGSGSAFVPTPLPFALGEYVTLAVRLDGIARILDLPVVIIGRRVGHKRAAAIADGVQVRMRDLAHPVAALVRSLACGTVVDLKSAVKSLSSVPVETFFKYNDTFMRAVDDLLARKDTTILVEEKVEVGDDLHLTMHPSDLLTLPPVAVVARGVILRDGERRVRIRLKSEADRAILLAAIDRRGTGRQQSA